MNYWRTAWLYTQSAKSRGFGIAITVQHIQKRLVVRVTLPYLGTKDLVVV